MPVSESSQDGNGGKLRPDDGGARLQWGTAGDLNSIVVKMLKQVLSFYRDGVPLNIKENLFGKVLYQYVCLV
jgi:hypothetical protein